MKAVLKRILKSEVCQFVLFIGIIAVIFFFYDFQHITFFRPQGIHQWRQCDCASFSLNYFHEGMDFFNPKIHYSGYDGTGKTISDFPLLYFFNAFLWKIFGYHEFISRLVSLLIFIAGIWYLSKSFKILTNDDFSGIILSLFLFTSPVLVYYANNFLTNVPSFGFSLIGFYFFTRFYFFNKNKELWLSMLFFLIGGLLKIDALSCFIAITGIFTLEVTGFVKFKENNARIFKNPTRQFIPFLIVIILVILWYKFAISYNQKHISGVFSTDILPIWSINKEKFNYVIDHVWVIQSKHYFHRWVQYIAILLFIVLLIFNKKVNRFLLTLTILLAIGTLSFIVLWFAVLDHHDYYVINQYITLVIIFITAFDTLFRNEILRKYIKFIPVFLFILLIPNVIYAKKKINERYNGWMNNQHTQYFHKLENITPFLRSLEIKREDKVLSMPDYSFNISLYLMDQKGFTNFDNKGKDSLSIQTFINDFECKYMIICDSTLLSHQYLNYFLKNKIGEKNGVYIYDLQHLSK